MSRYQDRIDLGNEFSQTLMKKLAHAVAPLGMSPPESFDGKLVYIMGNTTCEPKPGNQIRSDHVSSSHTRLIRCLPLWVHSSHALLYLDLAVS